MLLEVSNDPAVSDWVSLSEQSRARGQPRKPCQAYRRPDGARSSVYRALRGLEAEQIEPLVRLARSDHARRDSGPARESGVRQAGAKSFGVISMVAPQRPSRSR